MNPDDLPVLDENPARSLDVPAQVIPKRGSRVSIAMVGGIAAFIALAGIANRPGGPITAAGAPSSSVEDSRPSGTAIPREFAQRLASTAAPGPVLVLDLASPGPGISEVTSDRLTVAGRVLVRAARVKIVLSADGNWLIGQASADVSDRDGGIRPAYPPAVDVQFDLSGASRPSGTMQVVVTAYDEAGLPIGDVRRTVSVEPLAGS